MDGGAGVWGVLVLHIRPIICFSLSLQDTFEKRSREPSVEPTTRRPAEPYSPGDDESRDEEEGDSLLGSEHLEEEHLEEDDDDDIA
jgi:hypothetical protein